MATAPILVTGATGFLGAQLVRRLVADGHRVRIFRRERSHLNILQQIAYEEAIGDIADPVAVDRAVAGCRAVFHCAALIAYWEHLNALQTATNVEGTRHVVTASLRHGVARLIHVSSVSAIGLRADGAPADESVLFNLGRLRLNYADTKFAAECVVRDGVARGLDAVIINPGTIYGPGDHRRAYYVRSLASPVTSRGGMAVVDVDDVVEGAIRAWQHGRCGKRYILAAENRTYCEIGKRFAAALQRRGPLWVMPRWLIRVAAAVIAPLGRLFRRPWALTPTMARVAHLRFFFDNTKSCRELGMTYRPFTATAARTIAWMREERLV
ncbi:MAG: NAD-dependent epimerase/dehydratase family protein [Deltaproteobacteria bacterium]|nr:NAD-dependent epimerase/dehydratase family protein [Deltaproteobacteria bacterium]